MTRLMGDTRRASGTPDWSLCVLVESLTVPNRWCAWDESDVPSHGSTAGARAASDLVSDPRGVGSTGDWSITYGRGGGDQPGAREIECADGGNPWKGFRGSSCRRDGRPYGR